MQSLSWVLVLAIGIGLGMHPVQGVAGQHSLAAKILSGFFPYRDGVSQVEGITPGVSLTKWARSCWPTVLL